MIYENILGALGNTPLIKLNRLVPAESADIFVKYEGLNVGGSVKTRTAYYMVKSAMDKGLIRPGYTIITEPTSGNQGIGLALTGAVLGIEVCIIMPDSVSEERRKLIKEYGARLILVHDEGDIGECVNKCIAKSLELARNDKRVFIPSQFTNPDNPMAHELGTARELVTDMGDLKIDGFCSGIGTGGTISGVGRVLRKVNPSIHITALEPENAAILSGGHIGNHLQMGIGDGLIPDTLDTHIYDDIYIVKDEDAISTAKDLARKEGILCGISGGTNVWGALCLAARLGKGKNVVTLLPDTGERYYSTALFDD